MSPNRPRTHKFLFNFAFLCQIGAISCRHLESRPTHFPSDSQKVDAAVENYFKPGWVQIDEELTNICLILCFYARSSQIRFGVSNCGLPVFLATWWSGRQFFLSQGESKPEMKWRTCTQFCVFRPDQANFVSQFCIVFLFWFSFLRKKFVHRWATAWPW